MCSTQTYFSLYFPSKLFHLLAFCFAASSLPRPGSVGIQMWPGKNIIIVDDAQIIAAQYFSSLLYLLYHTNSSHLMSFSFLLLMRAT